MSGNAKSSSIRDVAALVEAGLVSPAMMDPLRLVEARYDIAITPAFRDLIQSADDPIGRQVIPRVEELDQAAFQMADPIGDARHTPVKGVVHRYEDRALLTPLLICPIYCRFCFRRERVGAEGGLLTDAELEAALGWFRQHPDVREVILTGGDPLMLSPRRLGRIIAALSDMAHIDIIRIHSRVPVADPERLTPALLDALSTEKALWLVTHVNHAAELSEAASQALRHVQKRGIPMLSQSVLLRGVNDSVEVMEALLRRLVRLGVKPYYLHHLDPAPGTEHFRVPVERGLNILRGLRGRVTGLAWPTYVMDIAGGYGKVPLGPHYLEAGPTMMEGVTDPKGRHHKWPNSDF
ncbi:lysine-2,3-aminomutase-like protein [Candidatus Kirkpatrickella diaphorinae]|uniref:Lysine-2,3-aminomutase-like protein n=1 Tax=Candidatus Kirkpatrickella diaphorinae TaxID=2984322 RepID=A0ABY6GKX1_9PROT|nr:lysine-2,3-aminomutase-like protein [Candidatus Kirkpatrickella diaphorinae]UYH51301.1 lysine-2,3-aminomutase-like protein [Candidatus Kirkpatrickella diaphorinae]